MNVLDCRSEAIVAVSEVVVESGTGDPGLRDRRGDVGARITGPIGSGDHAIEESFPLRGLPALRRRLDWCRCSRGTGGHEALDRTEEDRTERRALRCQPALPARAAATLARAVTAALSG